MKYLVVFLFVICFTPKYVQAQLRLDSLSTLPTYPSQFVPVSTPNPKGFTISIKYPKRLKLKNDIVDNPAIRYTMGNLTKQQFDDTKVNEAVNTLLQYAEDEKLKHVVEYLRNYSQTIASKERSLEMLQDKITTDSIRFYNGDELPEYQIPDMDDFLHTDLQTLTSYIRQDSNYLWLRKISRDSVYIDILSVKDYSKRFWINNGRMSHYRFWAANRSGDTIGTWIQVLPTGNQMRIFVDDDVYQATPVKTEISEKGIIKSKPPRVDIDKLESGSIRGRNWTYYSEVEFSMSQGALVNWAKGGENSLSIISNLRYFWNYNRNNTSWENWVHYRFGFMKNGEEDIRKNEDRFELNSKLGQKAFLHWYYTAQFNTLTQLFSSYDYPKDKERKLVANFMSPGYFNLSLGLDFKPNDNFSLFLSPISGKWNFVRDTAKIEVKRYGVEAGKRSRREAGARLDLNSKVSNLFNILEIRNQLGLFMSYEEKDRYKNFGKKDEEKKKFWGTVNWKLTLNFKINYFMRASIYTETIYDENYARKIQFKENLNLGVNFRF